MRYFLAGGGQGGSSIRFQGRERPQGKFDPENILRQALHLPPGEATRARQQRQDGLDARSDTALRHADGEGSPGALPTVPATSSVEVVFGDVRPEGW